MKRLKFNYKGFTLMELLVVVVIVAVLAAVAVPQYKKATLKARFSTAIPMAKAIADANEVYFQGRQLYALDVDELDVTPVNAENTSVTLSQTDGYDYVMAQNSQVPGVRYIIYQKYSENYPGEIHCEAADDNADAQWLCGVLSNNNSIGKTVTDGYTTYIINGTGAGLPVGAGNDDGGVSCSAAEAMGFSCNITTNEAGEQVKQICTNGFCRTQTYNEDGSYTSVTCTADSNGVCTSNLKKTTYDANGNITSQRTCSTVAADGTCSAYSSGNDYTYDENGNKTAQRYCSTLTSDGTCSSYSSGHDYTYDANGNLLSQRRCATVTADGSRCATYSVDNGQSTAHHVDYTYDENGNRIAERRCKTLGEDATHCGTFSDTGAYDYIYDENGRLVSQRWCNTLTADGSQCASYRPSSNYNYIYDENGNLVSRLECNPLTGTVNRTTCTGANVYNEYNSINYTYDDNGNMLAERRCNSLDSDGHCATYSAWYNYDYTYDANGNMTSKRTCKTLESDTTCSAYNETTYVYTYDDNGKQIAQQYCSGSNLNTTTGECIAYNSTTTYGN